VDAQGIVLDRTVFYPQGGGQAGDSGVLVLADGTPLAIADTRKAKDAEGKPTGQIAHVPAPGQEALSEGIARLVAAAHPVEVGAISDAELDANPALVKSMSVQPPRGTGQVRTIRIGGTIDFQPCGGTHVANTSEIGRVVVTKIEKKSASTRRVVLGFL
jgi:Ser-tRNA(Ala) deacylase AlaX